MNYIENHSSILKNYHFLIDLVHFTVIYGGEDVYIYCLKIKETTY